ncbi:MAG: insulinase family protein [Oscillospiraceae bacterium]|nr:insulinase family protein [Oscillospiraceae bacterium]
MVQRIAILPDVYLTAVTTDKFKTECISLNLLRPLCREEAAMNALLGGILLRGSKRCPDLTAVSTALEELYGAEIGNLIRRKGEVQCIGLFADCLCDEAVGEPIFAQTAAMAAELLLDPVTDGGVFREDYIAQEKENLIRSIRARMNGKRVYAHTQMVKAMFRDEAFGVDRLGEEADVNAITPENLFAHYRRVLATSRVEICYTGRKSPEAVAAILREALAALPRETCVSVGTVFVPRAERTQEIIERMDVTQGKLCMGFRTGRSVRDENWRASALMNAVFGGGLTSKLFLNVREKLSLCYYASSSIEKYKGFLCVSSGIDFDKFDVAKAAILEQLEACRRGEITEKELQMAKDHVALALRTVCDNPSRLDDFHLGNAVLGREVTPEELRKKNDVLTVGDLADAAKDVTLDTVFFLRGEAEQ